MNRLKKFFYLWGPVLLQMALIFYFSGQPSDSDLLEKFPFSSAAGHFGGYCLLALFTYRALIGSFRCWSIEAAAISFLIALVYGLSDELHQYFVPGRQPCLIDILVDGAGALGALLAVRLWVYCRQRLRRPGEVPERD